MQDGVVPDCTIVTDRERKTGIDVEHAVVLNVGALADFDQLLLRSQHRTEPDARVAFQAHLPDQHSRWSNPALKRVAALWDDTVERVDWHSTHSSSWGHLHWQRFGVLTDKSFGPVSIHPSSARSA